MPAITFQAVVTALLAGIAFLQPQTLTSEKDARVALPADALVRAVATQNDQLFRLCVADGLPVDEPGADGRTALLVSLDQGQRATVSRLLELGASVDASDAEGRTPLMVAAASGDDELLRNFLARSRQPDVCDMYGRSAAHYAAAAHQVNALQLLLPYTTDVTSIAEDGRDLLTIAADAGDPKMIEAILSRYPADAEWSPTAQRLLSAALRWSDAELVRLLLSKHAAPPTVEGSNIPLLAHAIVTEDLAMLKLLLSAGADPNITLPVPVEKRFAAAVESNYLRDYVRSDEGITPLMLAAGLGRLDSLRALLAAGAARNRQTSRHQMLALYFATRTNKPQCVQLLLGRGPSRDELRVEISLALQRASVFKNGIAVLNTSVSTGRKGFDTPAGEYVITDKDRSHRSTIYHAEMPFFMRLNCRDFGMHAGVVPNYPASHGCIRLPADVAERLFSEIPVGTMVTIN
ncbi:MAG: ankyrin repeat domain-containing protein [Chthoniobacterales bacterium]